MLEAAKMCVHHIQGHLAGVEMKMVSCCDFEHPQMDRGIFVSGEPDVTNLTCLLSRHQCFQRSVFREEAVGIFHTNVLVKLEQIHVVCLESAERLVEWTGSRRFRAAVELSHQECFLAISIAQSHSHPLFALAVV